MHAGTYAFRLRISNLSATQIYPGKPPDTEAMRWIENLYA